MLLLYNPHTLYRTANTSVFSCENLPLCFLVKIRVQCMNFAHPFLAYVDSILYSLHNNLTLLSNVQNIKYRYNYKNITYNLVTISKADKVTRVKYHSTFPNRCKTDIDFTFIARVLRELLIGSLPLF